MPVTAVMLPVFIQVALTVYLVVAMGQARVRAIKNREVKLEDFKYGGDIWPNSVKPVINCFHNQFQMPVLFYAVVLFAIVLNKADLAFAVLAWAFAISRIIHALVYLKFNNVLRRFRAFVVGLVILCGMWVLLAARLVLEGA